MTFIRFLLLFAPLLFSCQESTQSVHENQNNVAQTAVKDTSTEQTINYQDIEKKFLLGQIKPQQNDQFVEIPVPIANRENLYMQKQALESFQKMQKTASKENIQLQIISAFRSFTHQKWIWNSKFNGKRRSGGKNMAKEFPDPQKRVQAILNYSAMPGTSRHHWGTDIDINNLNNSYFESGKGKTEYEWLKKNAHKFGFYQTYTANREDGYNEEKWHWSYTPLAKDFSYNYKKKISYADIKGFKGSEHAQDLKVIERYVLNNINNECMHEPGN
ncbi:MAG: M15 family metallopeptidase [Bacteroidales bacterium]|nr:M15 family metallopeptidase [Bacteroidales bacterium]MCF8328125.1 M15 family metallopeptidase [Bacteroidales bacterium]